MPSPPAPAALPTRFSHRETVVILAGLMLAMFLAALDQTIVATALPRMAAELQGVAHLSWVVSAYLLTSTAATPIYGKLSDLYGRKRMLQAAIAIFLVTSLLCGLARSMGQLILFRALQGLGGGGLIAMAHATIADVISPRERGRYQAYIAGSFAVASVVGPVLGGIFTDYLSWRWVFWINLPFGLGALAMAELTLKRLVVRRERHRIDYAGAILIVAAVACLLLVTTLGGNEVPWGSPVIAGLLLTAAVLFVLCILQERMTLEPILPPRLFRNHTYVVANLINFLTAIGLLGTMIFLPLFLQLVYGLTARHSGLVLIPLTGGMITSAIVTGRAMARTGRTKPYPLIGIPVTITGLLVLSFATAATPLPLAAAAMAVAGMGMGLVNPVMMVAVQNAVEIRDLGTATSSISFFRSLGGSFGVALFGAVLIAVLNHDLAGASGIATLGPDPGLALLRAGAGAIETVPPAFQGEVVSAMTGAFHAVFRVAMGLSFLTLGAALALRELPLKTTPAAVPGRGDAGELAD